MPGQFHPHGDCLSVNITHSNEIIEIYSVDGHLASIL